MSTNARIWLPSHATKNRILKVVAQCLGCDMALTSNSSQSIDPSLPCSKGNPWTYALPQGFGYCEQTKEGGFAVGYGTLVFQAGPQGLPALEWFLTSEPEEEESGHLLLPDSTALAVAVGLRLVAFFGGTMDPVGMGEQRTTVSDKDAKFAQKKAEQSSDERWYEFNNTVGQETMLSEKDLHEGVLRSEYGVVPSEQGIQAWVSARSLEQKMQLVSHGVLKAGPRPRL